MDSHGSDVLEAAHAEWPSTLEDATHVVIARAGVPTPSSCMFDRSPVETPEESIVLEPEQNDTELESSASGQSTPTHMESSASDQSTPTQLEEGEFQLQPLDTPTLCNLMRCEELPVQSQVLQGLHNGDHIPSTLPNAEGPSSLAAAASPAPLPPAVVDASAAPRQSARNSSQDADPESPASPHEYFSWHAEGPSGALRLAAASLVTCARPATPCVIVPSRLAPLKADTGVSNATAESKGGDFQGVHSWASLSRCYCRFLHCWWHSAKPAPNA